MVKRHWPYYRLSGCDILGIGRTNQKCEWPSDINYVHDIGESGHVGRGNLPLRLVTAFEYMATTKQFNGYDRFCLIEADSIFTRPMPAAAKWFSANLACGPAPGFRGNLGFHCPWIADHMIACAIAGHGYRMIANGDIERGWPDRFIGWLVEKNEIPWSKANTYSRNALDRPEYVEQAREAIRNGVYHVHGIKTLQQLAALADLIPLP